MSGGPTCSVPRLRAKGIKPLGDLLIAIGFGCGAFVLPACGATTESDAAMANDNVTIVQARAGFDQWLERFKREASAAGISEPMLRRAFSEVKYNERVVERDSHQPEFTRPIWKYLDSAVSEARVATGRTLLVRHRELLEDIGRTYGVDPPYLVAIWGLESNYGSSFGDFNVVEALATLAFHGRRKEFGRQQLLAALRILDNGDIAPSQMLGSWAGAMGHTQFIPSTYLMYAVDHDGDGNRDLWNSVPDALASTANYLAKSRWRRGDVWGFEVRLPSGFDWRLSDPTVRKPLSEWTGLGIRRADGGDLPGGAGQAAVLVPAGHRGPAFVVLENFGSIKRYNSSTSYALAVGHLADRISGRGPIAAKWPRWLAPLSRADKLELQRRLSMRGYDLGTVDGIVGPKTRKAVRRFQSEVDLPPDGYPSADLLNRLRSTH